MIIVDLPAPGPRGGLRVGAIGSCRLVNPFIALTHRGDVRIPAEGLEATHTAAEALQAIEVVRGERVIPAHLNRYIFNQDEAPAVDRLQLGLRGGVDVFLLEVAEARQFIQDGVCLQQNFVGTNLVGAYGAALLPWFRRLCKGVATDDATVVKALKRLTDRGYAPDETLEKLLRTINLERVAAADVKRDLAAMMAKMGGRWVVVGPCVVAGVGGDIMNDRREVREELRDAAEACGAVFYDPSRLIDDHGRATVLAENGADIYEWSEDFYPTVGETLVALAISQAEPGPGVSKRSRQTAGSPQQAAKSRAALADGVNAELVALHRCRLAELGGEASSLSPHYQALTDRSELVGRRERSAFELIAAHLPQYDAYGVLRAGWGELALLLAASGRRVIAYEADPRHCLALQAGAQCLREVGLIEEGALTVVESRAPDSPPPEGTLGVGLGAVMGRDPALSEALMPHMAAFEGLLINLRTFLIMRESLTERETAAEELTALGFGRVRDYPAEGLTWFRRNAVGGPAPP